MNMKVMRSFSRFGILCFANSELEYLHSCMYDTRESAQEMIDSMPDFYRSKGDNTEAESWEKGNHIIFPITISLPARNCDVGTLTEQQQRGHDYCEKKCNTQTRHVAMAVR